MFNGARTHNDVHEIVTLDPDNAWATAPVNLTHDANCNLTLDEAVIPLHPQLAAALKSVVDGSSPKTRLFTVIPKNTTYNLDLERAGIDKADANGRVLDFHALRKTMAMRLIRSGTHLSVAKRITRHRRTQTLEKHYDGLDDRDIKADVDGLSDLPGFPSSVPSAVPSAVRTSPQSASSSIKRRSDAGKRGADRRFAAVSQVEYTATVGA